jgi:hypothetical protein
VSIGVIGCGFRASVVFDGRSLCGSKEMNAVGRNYVSLARPFALVSFSAAQSLLFAAPTDDDSALGTHDPYQMQLGDNISSPTA